MMEMFNIYIVRYGSRQVTCGYLSTWNVVIVTDELNFLLQLNLIDLNLKVTATHVWPVTSDIRVSTEINWEINFNS